MQVTGPPEKLREWGGSDNLGSFTGGPRKKIRITSTLLDTGGNDSCYKSNHGNGPESSLVEWGA